MTPDSLFQERGFPATIHSIQQTSIGSEQRFTPGKQCELCYDRNSWHSLLSVVGGNLRTNLFYADIRLNIELCCVTPLVAVIGVHLVTFIHFSDTVNNINQGDTR